MSQLISVSIIIPAYNEESQLRRCLDSVAKQSVAPDEVILVDNNSTDDTVEIAKSYPFVKVVTEERQGVVFARDRGFDEVSSAIIGRIDVDTVLSANWVETVKEYFLDSRDVAAVTGDCYFYDFPFQKLSKSIHHAVYYRLQKLVSGTEILWGSNMAIRKDAWLSVRDKCIHRRGIHEDIDLSLQIRDQGLTVARYSSLAAGVSLRRGSLDPYSNYRYLKPWTATYWENKRYFQAILIALITAVILIITFLPCSLYWLCSKIIR